jgi:ribose/xylose/arabinose/galactoside ABC-type transport system permease subunit
VLTRDAGAHDENQVTEGGSGPRATAASWTGRGRSVMSTMSEHWGLVVANVVLFGLFSVFAPYFLTQTNLLDILLAVSFFAIVAWPMTFVIVAAEIDISVGSAVAFDGVVLALLVDQHGWSIWLAFVAVLMMGTMIGLGAGYLRAVFNIPSFIVTLALYGGLRSLAALLTNALAYPVNNQTFDFLGSGLILGIPVPAIIAVLLFFAFWFVGTRTVYGRWVYAVGGNAQTARLAGINVPWVRISVFGLTGLFAALSGTLLAAQLEGGDPATAQGFEFSVISAVIIGGTSLFGGRGSLVGTALGLLLIAMLQDGLTLLGVNQYAQGVTEGIVILVAVLASSFNNSMRSQGAASRVRRDALKRVGTLRRLGGVRKR